MTPEEIDEAARRVRTRESHAIVVRALTLYHAGWQPQRVAAEVGVARSTVHEWRAQSGVPRNNTQSQDKRLPPEELERAARLYEAGLTENQIAERMGLAQATVSRRLDNAGVVRRPRGGHRARMPAGYVSPADAAKVVGMSTSGMLDRCRENRCPGARLFPAARPFWGIPAAGLKDMKPNRQTLRPKAKVTNIRKRTGEVYLPIQPFADWINAQKIGTDEIARRAGMVDGGRVRLWAKLEGGVTVGMSTADVILTANDARLDDVWEDLDDLLASVQRSLESIASVAA